MHTKRFELFRYIIRSFSERPRQISLIAEERSSQRQKLFAIFWGKTWATNTGTKGVPAAMNTFFSDILISPLIDQLSEYNVAGLAIGHGSFIGSKAVTAGAPTSSVTDLTIQKALKKWISAGTVPRNDKDAVYFIFLEPGIVSVMGEVARVRVIADTTIMLAAFTMRSCHIPDAADVSADWRFWTR